MTTMTASAAMRSGMSRGLKLAINPTVENYKALRTPPLKPRSVTQEAWEDTGRSLRRAMDMERRAQRR